MSPAAVWKWLGHCPYFNSLPVQPICHGLRIFNSLGMDEVKEGGVLGVIKVGPDTGLILCLVIVFS